MCGRYVLYSETGSLEDHFAASSAAVFKPGYNVAPGAVIPAVRLTDADRELIGLRWGLIPGWAKTASVGHRMINARAGGIASKPAFRSAFRRQRCLIPANGFYEWQAQMSGKQPFYIHLLNAELFAFAGLWEHWQSPAGDVIESCTIITTEPNVMLAPFHDRMPVILDTDEYAVWLDGKTTEQDLLALLNPYPADEMDVYPVSTRVGSPRNKGADLIEPLPAS